MSLALVIAATVSAVSADPGSEAFLAAYRDCAATMATIHDIDNCEAFGVAMQKAMADATTAVRLKAMQRDRYQVPPFEKGKGLVAQLVAEQAAWDRYNEVACSHYSEREIWGTDGQRIRGPVCGMLLDTNRLRELRQLLADLD